MSRSRMDVIKERLEIRGRTAGGRVDVFETLNNTRSGRKGRKSRIVQVDRETVNERFADLMRYEMGEWGTSDTTADTWPDWALDLFDRYELTPAESVDALKDWLLWRLYASQGWY